ncbi:hypothetical protein [Alteromonas mediterranea]|mgnify:CR=1 FL=1|uniref:Peptidase n=1 Tax=Alteromonas mediterranea (strain DSM 17117 / CIP 110805 / LMG 28347 / Deep ecotype) TaxID=1774373 RepID=F2GAH0_ALTMD|nr:hypothetical protein [Alteromonas mediterranea]AEA98904.1 hypothetical protein MADE_1013850 [Alteromonas mediterranea DE]CAH1189448.1 hypothetical protein ISS312_00564 [Alteromonas mediterranea]
MQKFQVALSLGTNCQSRYNISKAVYERQGKNPSELVLGENRKNVEDYGTFYFDWSITPIQGLVKTLDAEFHGAFELENLELCDEPNNKKSVVDNFNGLIYPHSFPGSNDGTLTELSLRELYPQLKNKFNYLADKTLETLCSNKEKLLICNFNEPTSAVLELCNFVNQRYKNFKLILIPHNNRGLYDNGIKGKLSNFANVEVHEMPYSPYPGAYTDWKKILDQYDFNIG